MERWVENLVNASIDIGKIVVAAEMLPLPHTYRETMETLAAVPQFRDLAADLPRNTAAQNALAQEYLDLRYSAVQRAADSAVDLYGGLADATERWLENTESAG
jgi:uncharacterized protein YutE (UPF0331/DUF86 family)